jgi:hypothetical protein
MRTALLGGSKPRWSLLPWHALDHVLGAFEFGARKYAVNDWLNRPQLDHIDGAFRHLTAWLQGDRRDPETGLSHLAHAGARVLMALALECAHDSEERAA